MSLQYDKGGSSDSSDWPESEGMPPELGKDKYNGGCNTYMYTGVHIKASVAGIEPPWELKYHVVRYNVSLCSEFKVAKSKCNIYGITSFTINW